MVELKHPLWRYFDRQFKRKRSWIWKVTAAGILGLIFAVVVLLKIFVEDDDVPSLSTVFWTFVALPAIFMFLAGIMIRADVARRNRREGRPVGVLSRLLFCEGIWSLLFWIIILIAAGVPLAYWLGSVNPGHAG